MPKTELISTVDLAMATSAAGQVLRSNGPGLPPVATDTFTIPMTFDAAATLANAVPLRSWNRAGDGYVEIARVRSDNAVNINAGGAYTVIDSLYNSVGPIGMYVTGLNVGGQGVCVAPVGNYFAVNSVGAAQRLLGLDGSDRVTISGAGIETDVLGAMKVAGSLGVNVTTTIGTFHVGGQVTLSDLTTSVDFKHWNITPSGPALDFRLYDDAVSISSPWMTVYRSGMTVSYLSFPSGAPFIYRAKTSTGAVQDQGKIVPSWGDSTDGTRKGRLSLLVSDYTGTDKEGLRIDTDGTTATTAFAANVLVNTAGLKMTIGGIGALPGFSGLWLDPVPASTNYAFLGKPGQTLFNVAAGGFLAFLIGNTIQFQIDTTATLNLPLKATGGTFAPAGAPAISPVRLINSSLNGNNYIKLQCATTAQDACIESGPASGFVYDGYMGLTAGVGMWGVVVGGQLCLTIDPGGKVTLPSNGLTAHGAVNFAASSATTPNRAQGGLTPSWADNADGTRKGRLSLSVADYSGVDKEALRLDIDANGGTRAICRMPGRLIVGGTIDQNATILATDTITPSVTLYATTPAIVAFWQMDTTNSVILFGGVPYQCRYRYGSHRFLNQGETFEFLSLTTTAAVFGVPVEFAAAGRTQARILPAWADANDATRRGRLSLLAADASGTDREGLRVESDGGGPRTYVVCPQTAPVDAQMPNDSLTFFLDETNKKLSVRVKFADGTAKTGEITLV